MTGTPYFYAGSPCAVVAATVTPDGVKVSISLFGSDESPGSACVMDLSEFRRFAADTESIIADTETAQAATEHDDLFTHQEGHH